MEIVHIELPDERLVFSVSEVGRNDHFGHFFYIFNNDLILALIPANDCFVIVHHLL